MDDHVKQMLDLTALISEVKSTTTVQTQRVAAQLDGLRAIVDSNNNTTKSDIIDLRGRIVQDLCDQNNAINANIKCLEDRLESSDATTLRTMNDLEPASRCLQGRI